MNDQETDKGEVGGSSPPRPTTHRDKKAFINNGLSSFQQNKAFRQISTTLYIRRGKMGGVIIILYGRFMEKDLDELVRLSMELRTELDRIS